MQRFFVPGRVATIKQPLQSVIVFVFLPVEEKKKITLVLFIFILQNSAHIICRR